MELIFQIAIGSWLGGLFVVGTVIGYMEASTRIERARRYGHPWWHHFVPSH